MKFFLRPVEEKDGPSIVRWRNDPNVLSHCLDKTRITIESNSAFFKNFVLTGKYKQFIVECLDEITGACIYPIASVYLKDMDYGNKRCELCIFTSSDVEWNSEGQIVAIEMLTKKAFDEYGMHKVFSYVFKKFPGEVDLLRKAGFTIEAVLKQEAINIDGQYEDVVRMCVIRKDI
jgi:RimJ/RimL family protein N-acetyltransferase